MKRWILCSVLIALPAIADDTSPLVEACVEATKHVMVTDEIYVGVVQDLTNLTPPRVVMRFSDEEEGQRSRLSQCEFTQGERPFGLRELWVGSIQYNETGIHARRFNEIAELLRRDGY